MAQAQVFAESSPDETSAEGRTSWLPDPSLEHLLQEEQLPQLSRRPRRLHQVAAIIGAAALGVFALVGFLRFKGNHGRSDFTLPPGEAALELSELHGKPSVQPLHQMEVPPPPPRSLLKRTALRAHSNVSAFAELRELSTGTTCDRLMLRLSTLSSQEIASGAKDMEFPDTMDSIAAPGSNCGDAAAGIHESCSKYNTWATFQTVASRMHGHFEVMAAKGPEYQDIGQGELGTCYFLAALASIAYSDPKVIQSMFVDQGKWSDNVYTTRWLLNGREVNVKVNNKIPAHHSSRPFFVQPSDAGEWWPVILEKTWAKIYGSFHAVEGGLWENAVQAITMSPVMRHRHEELSQSQVFALLVEATKKGWPMGAGTNSRCTKYGLAQGHAYSVLQAGHANNYGQVVKLYNPWNQDHYHGAVPNTDKGDGLFTMTLAEYFDAFDDTSIANVYDHYKIASKLIQTESVKMSSWEFSVSSSDPFYVTLTWPGHRIVKPCEMIDPISNLIVMKKGQPDTAVTAPKQLAMVSSASVEVKLGPGDYVAVAGLHFPTSDKVHEGHLIVYSSSSTSIKESSQDAATLLGQVFGPTDSHGNPCDVVFIKTKGVFSFNKRRLVHGVPTYWSSDAKDFAYWVGQEKKWFLITEDYFARVNHGHLWSFAKVSKEDMSCGCADAVNGVAGFSGVYCNAVKGSQAKYSNVKCEGSQYSDLVQRYCPLTCGAGICSGEAPTLPPRPTEPAGAGGDVCEDSEHPRVTLDHHPATCKELGDKCHEYRVIQEECCATCAKLAEQGGISNEECQDHTPPGIVDPHGKEHAHCSELKAKCSSSEAVRERCCITCRGVSGVGGVCQEGFLPSFLKPKDGEFSGCSIASSVSLLCGLDAIKKECCQTCAA